MAERKYRGTSPRQVEATTSIEAQALLAAIVESSNDAILTKDLDGVVTSWNAGAERLYGYKAHDVLGHPIMRIVPRERWPEEEHLLARVRLGKRVANYETVRTHKDGHLIEISLSLSPIYDKLGQIVGASGIGRDIGSRRKSERELQDSEARYRSLVHASGAIVFRSDATANWLERNPAWEDYTGQRFEQYRGHGWSAAVHAEDRSRIIDSVQLAIKATAPWHDEARIWHHESQSYRYQEARAVPILGPDGAVREWVGTCLDIHARKVAEQAVRDADRRKDNFLAVLAHELRNPLAPISTGIQLLHTLNSEPQQLDILSTMKRQVQHLVRLIDDLMEVSRISRGAIELRKETFPLQDSVRAAIGMCAEVVEANGHKMVVTLSPEPIYVYGDRVRLTQIFANLLSNSAKYTPHGGNIHVALDTDDGHARLRVTDNGIGISPEHIERIFEMFGQTGRVVERFTGGLGIGLGLARHLAALHGGSVHAESAGENQGSVFTVRVPLVQPEHRREVNPCVPDVPPKRIVVVDDNKDAASTMAALLTTLGHDVTVAYDGPEALRLAKAFPPDAVLLDLGLPRLSGYAVAEEIRRLPRGAGIRLIALTGWGQPADRKRTEACGFDAHLVKPAAIQDICRALAGP